MNNLVLRADSRFFVSVLVIGAALLFMFSMAPQAHAGTLSVVTATTTSSNASSTLAKVGDTVNFGLNLNGTPVSTSTPVINIEGMGTTSMTGSGAWWSYSTTTSASWSQGAVSFNFGFGDSSPGTSNSTTTVKSSSISGLVNVVFDSVKPTLYQLSIKSSNTGSSTLAKALDTITVTATSSENIASTSTFTIDGQAATFSMVTASTTWKGTYQIQQGDTEGVVHINLIYADSAGNVGSDAPFTLATSSQVTVDTTKPVITLVGSSPDTAYLQITYVNPGATVADSPWGDISSALVETGSVNTNALGDNTLTYNASDSAGNAATTVNRTVTVTQQAQSGSSGGGGGGGGGGVFVPYIPPNQTTSKTPTTPSTPAAPVSGLSEAQVQSILTLLASFNADQSVIDKVNASLHGQATAGTSASSGFDRDLDVGATGDDVKALQVFLNAHGFPVSSSGAGSPGNETSLFGSLTKAALAKYQAANGISPAAGYFGPKTRTFIH